MWLAALSVGVFGNDFVSNSSGSSTSIPVVVFLLPFVLPASISVARHGFKESVPTDTLRGELEEETRTREELADDVSELRAELVSEVGVACGRSELSRCSTNSARQGLN
jgi:hypothetical protein